jgi:hypothetical protein
VAGRSGGAIPWVIYVILGAPIATFFTTIAAEAGKDAYQPIKRWAVELLAARRGGGAVDIRDSDGMRLVFSSELPDEALAALSNLDWSKFQRSGIFIGAGLGANGWKCSRRLKRSECWNRSRRVWVV